MGTAPGPSLMRRMTRPVTAPTSATPVRALRLAMVRAAKDSVALPLAVLGIREEEGPLDDLLSRLEDGLLLVALHDGEGPAGLLALDLEARSAVIEAQALGRVSDAAPEQRPPTKADAALAERLFFAFLHEAELAVADTPLATWLSGLRLGASVPGAKESALLLADGLYRSVRLTLDLVAGGRQGLLLLLLRVPGPPRPAEPPAPDVTLAQQVMAATLPVRAVLHRLPLTLSEAESLATGQVIALPGVTVSSVSLEASGRPLGPARLGQVAGMRAVRLEVPLAPDLGTLPALGGADSAPSESHGASPLPEPATWSLESKGAPAWGPPEIMTME